MDAWRMLNSLTRAQRNTFIASFLGWALDAFDFFLVVLVVPAIARDFVPAKNGAVDTVPVAFAITLTLAMRPVGALIFGVLADRFGRRLPLMIDIAFYSVMEFATAFSPNLTVFLILRALFGIGMGGEWGIGASLAMESLPTESRGLFSGILQEGYAFGYLLAAVVAALAFPLIGWRGMFLIGTLPALMVLFIRVGVPESPVFEQRRTRNLASATGMLAALQRRWPLFLYLVVLMTAFNFMSHGSQDIYPTFLQKQVGLTVSGSSVLAIIYNVGAICGGIFFGYNSQRWGRRRAVVIAAALGILLIPLWAGLFSFSVVALAIGAFLMQFMVQGAWGVIPVHLNELSPGAVRGTFPGFAYQLGNLCAAITPTLLTAYAQGLGSVKHPNFSLAQAILIAGVFAAVIVITWLGPEVRAKIFHAAEDEELGTQILPSARRTDPD